MQRPIITAYTDQVHFLSDMLAFRKETEAGFSILSVSRGLRRISPALISLILKRKRRITLDRVDELSKLLNLTPHERQYLRDWISRSEEGANLASNLAIPGPTVIRKVSSSHILSDWINVFVKDAFDLPHVRRDPTRVYSALGGIASKKRIDQAVLFLLKHGYLRRTIDGQMIPEAPLHSVDQKISNDKVRKFHKALLRNAQEALDQHPTDKRYANAMVLSLNQETYKKLIDLIAEQAESLQSFAENLQDGTMLYQLVINVSPTGGHSD